MRHVTCFNQVLKSIEGKIDTRTGIFDFLGLDFLIDDELNVWFIEVNVNPALHRNSVVLDDVITKAVTTAVDIVCDIFDRQSQGKEALPLQVPVGDMEMLVGGG